MHSKAIEAAARAIDRALAWDVESVDARATELTREEQTKVAQACIAAYLAAMEAEGVVLVPVEPTEAMIDAGFDHHPKHFEAQMGKPPTPEEDMDWQYRAMLSARPNVKG